MCFAATLLLANLRTPAVRVLGLGYRGLTNLNPLLGRSRVGGSVSRLEVGMRGGEMAYD